METPICTLEMLRKELRDKLNHGLKEHKGDWYHQWARNRKGTLSYIWHHA